MIDLVKARALCAAATPGNWHFDNEDYVWAGDDKEPCRAMICEMRGHGTGEPYISNAAFIAAARTLLPEALESLEQSLARERDIMEMLMLAQDERDALKAEVHELRINANWSTKEAVKYAKALTDPLEAENARLRPVVDAAVEMVNCPDCDLEGDGHIKRLVKAVRALAAPQTGGADV